MKVLKFDGSMCIGFCDEKSLGLVQMDHKVKPGTLLPEMVGKEVEVELCFESTENIDSLIDMLNKLKYCAMGKSND